MIRQCPLLEQCKKASGIDCRDRNFDGKQPHISMMWKGREPCDFYKNLEREKREKPRVKRKSFN